jgi:phosphoglycerate dehydrogenase-like enzyme
MFLTKGQQADPGLSPIGVSGQERVLFALTEREQSQIFPSRSDQLSLPAPYTWISPETFSSGEDWARYLTDFRPTVLVSCWATPLLPPDLLFTDSLPLRYVCHVTGSVKAVVPRNFIMQGGIVTNWGNLVSHSVAEHALLLILASLRNLARWPSDLQADPYAWGSGLALKTRSLRGKRVGIHGFGGIACELIQMLKPFDVKCMAFSQNVPPSYMEKKGASPSGSLEDLFRNCDVVVECEALTPETKHMVRDEHFRMMAEDSVFVNVARGAIVDEAAMARHAAKGRIRVASDVFQTEPLPDDSPLRAATGVIISPHIGGPTGDSYPRCGEVALKNLERYLEGKPLEGLVTLEIYDRST